jgi:serine beta-lactamase-like protein LACTB
MRRILPYSLALLGVACGTLAAMSVTVDATRQIEPRAAVQDRVREARDRVRAFLEGQRVPGASIAVSRGGRIIWSEGFGLAHLEHRVAATPATRFRVGSISKAITSVALARLVEAGRLDLDAPVQRYAPTFPEKEYPITSRQLGGHLAGLPHYTQADVVNTVRYQSVTDALRKFQDRPLLFRPGERFYYSSYGWNLLSVVVEGASGESFLEHMSRQVFQPLGMTRTAADEYDRIIEGRTGFYTVTANGMPINAPAVDNSDVWAGGGLLSTAEDLVRFGDGVIAGPVVGDRGRALLWTPMQTSAGSLTDYGFGWEVRVLDGRKVVGHGGAHVGATARLVLVPDERLVIAILTNSGNRGQNALIDELTRLFLAN